MQKVWESRFTQAIWIFDLEDRYRREQQRRGQVYHPRPLGPVTFWLIGETVGGVPTPFSQPMEMVVVENPSGYHLFFGEVKLPSGATSQPDGSTSRPTGNDHRHRLQLVDGTYSVRVTSPFYQGQVRDDIIVPMPNPNDSASGAPYFFDLAPGYAYPFPEPYPWRPADSAIGCPGSTAESASGPTLLRGSLHTFDGQPLEGATIKVETGTRVYEYATDRTGQWVLVFDRAHPTGAVIVQITRPGGAVVNVAGVCVIRGRETTLHQTALRGWVQRDGIGVPGATITVSGQLQQTPTRPDGSWYHYFELTQADTIVDVTATLPGGGPIRTHRGVQVKSRATNVVDTFRF
jgi:hypothetical protein